jgi:hypothetical protein
MEEQQEKHDASKAPSNPEVIPQSQATVGAEKDNPPSEAHSAIGAQQEDATKPKSWVRRLFGIDPDRQVELAMAFAITFFAAASWITSCQDSASSTAQTNKLITAANQQAVAAQQFATSADKINSGVADAVTKLDAQAKAIEASRKSSELTSTKAWESCSVHNDADDNQPQNPN